MLNASTSHEMSGRLSFVFFQIDYPLTAESATFCCRLEIYVVSTRISVLVSYITLWLMHLYVGYVYAQVHMLCQWHSFQTFSYFVEVALHQRNVKHTLATSPVDKLLFGKWVHNPHDPSSEDWMCLGRDNGHPNLTPLHCSKWSGRWHSCSGQRTSEKGRRTHDRSFILLKLCTENNRKYHSFTLMWFLLFHY